MICLVLFNGILNHILTSQVTAPFSCSREQTTNFILWPLGITMVKGGLSAPITITMFSGDMKLLPIPSAIFWLPIACHACRSKVQLDLKDINKSENSYFMVAWCMVTRLRTRKQWSSFICSLSVEKQATWGLSAALLCCRCHRLWVIRWWSFKLVNKLTKQHFDLKNWIRTSK